MSFDLLEHPADIGFRARGATLEELFANSAHALLSIILDPSDIRPIQSISIPGSGADRESLLVNWLNEVLYYVDGRRMALGTFDVVRVDETRVECIARGEPRSRPASITYGGKGSHLSPTESCPDGRWMDRRSVC